EGTRSSAEGSAGHAGDAQRAHRATRRRAVRPRPRRGARARTAAAAGHGRGRGSTVKVILEACLEDLDLDVLVFALIRALNPEHLDPASSLRLTRDVVRVVIRLGIEDRVAEVVTARILDDAPGGADGLN